MKRGNLRADYRIFGSLVDIDLRPMSIVFGHIVVSEDCFHRTFGHARIAIDAGVGVDVEAVRQFVKCFDRAHGGTVGIFAVNAQLNNYIGHWWNKLLSIMANSYSVMSGMSTVKSHMRNSRGT
jgi:hypothetical protein